MRRFFYARKNPPTLSRRAFLFCEQFESEPRILPRTFAQIFQQRFVVRIFRAEFFESSGGNFISRHVRQSPQRLFANRIQKPVNLRVVGP